MLGRSRSFPFFMVTVISGISLWAHGLQTSVPFPLASAEGVELQTTQDPTRESRVSLLKILDRIASHEHYYHSVYGRYTRVLGQLGVEIPESVARIYEIEVQQANADRFLLTAFSEASGQAADLVTLDHLDRVRANFPIPEPDTDYLKAYAQKQLRNLLAERKHGRFRETGVFRGRFDYSIRHDSSGHEVAVAVGVRAPVLGLEIEQEAGHGTKLPDFPDSLDALEREALAHTRTGQQRQSTDTLEALKEVYLAQKIFHGEVGRYADSWAELSKIAGFRFADQNQLRAEAARLPASQRQALLLDIEPIPEDASSTSRSHSLVIEPIASGVPSSKF
jgi:hypothetical protein